MGEKDGERSREKDAQTQVQTQKHVQRAVVGGLVECDYWPGQQHHLRLFRRVCAAAAAAAAAASWGGAGARFDKTWVSRRALRGDESGRHAVQVREEEAVEAALADGVDHHRHHGLRLALAG